MEIKNRLTDTRGEEGRVVMGERWGRGKSRNTDKGPMVKDNGVGVDVGVGGRWGRGE